MDKLFQAIEANNEDIQEQVLQCLTLIGQQEYDFLQYYFNKIYQITSTAT